MVPPLFLIFLVLGTIFIGVATPTEGGAMGAIGAILLAIFKRFSTATRAASTSTSLQPAVEATAKLSAFVVFILVGARIFSLTFYGVNGHLWVEHLLDVAAGRPDRLPRLRQRPGVPPRLLPRFLRDRLHHHSAAGPAAEKIGIDLIWLGVMLGVNMQTSFMHPAVRLCAVLSALGGAAGALQGQGDGADDAARDHRADLLGRRAVRDHPVMMVALLIAFPGLGGHDAKPLPWAQTPQGLAAPHAGAGGAPQERGFSLSPYPPEIPGAPPPTTTGLGRRRSIFQRRRSSFGRLNRPWHRAALTRACCCMGKLPDIRWGPFLRPGPRVCQKAPTSEKSMALPEGPSAAAAVTSPTLDLKWSLTLRVVTVALLCFVIAAAITLVGTYRDVRRANEDLAEMVTRQLQLQLFRINSYLDVPARFPDWDPVVTGAQTAGQCIQVVSFLDAKADGHVPDTVSCPRQPWAKNLRRSAKVKGYFRCAPSAGGRTGATRPCRRPK